MNPALTTGLLKSINSNEINVLSPPNETFGGMPNELFSSKLVAAMQDSLSQNGKFSPLALASLKGLDSQQLMELVEQSGIQLPPQLMSELSELPTNLLSLQTHDLSAETNLLGNPAVNAVLNTTVINDDLLENGLLNNQVNKPGPLTTGPLTKEVALDALQQSLVKKESVLSRVFKDTDIDLSQYLKGIARTEVDAISKSGHPEINTTKLVDQLASIDKPVNPINSISNHSVQTYSNHEQSGLMLRRIEVPVQQAGWSEAVGNRLMMMVNDKMHSARIHLNPPELGPIEVRVNVNHDQASVQFISSHTAVRDAIEDAFPRLKEMFMQNGLSLTDANVSQESSQHANPDSGEQNDSLTIGDKESLETPDAQTENNHDNTVGIGLIDHYV